MSNRLSLILVGLILAFSYTPAASAQFSQPEIIQEHWYHSYATLTLDVNEWADENPDIVRLVVAGQTELGRNLWVLQISDWSMDMKVDGSPKEVVYIDGGHHGNEHLGTELAFLTAKHYIDGWNDGDEIVQSTLESTELHILIMLNADGNDFDTRWNVNQVDLNRNYAHYWNTCPTTQPGTSAFSESETLANSIYMQNEVSDADLYVTMHTGVWIMLYPWGKWPEQPSDWELFHHVRDEVNSNISDIPIRNANQGLYPNCGTSRDYGYGVMGFPTFTFETDDEQFLLGTVEPLSERLDEELDVMTYLVENVWYWRARLQVEMIQIENNNLRLNIDNLGHATTRNATLIQTDGDGAVIWESTNFTVNASSNAVIDLGFYPEGSENIGNWSLYYQKRVIDSSTWVTESVEMEKIDAITGESSLLPFPNLALTLIATLFAAKKKNPRSHS
ncbi:MAG: M14 family metallopeptidase [Candidatus Thermoplasmatota archaeon]|nr:M14 family metallopeptidase [Candidatus Thermoplasmatota archaeon]